MDPKSPNLTCRNCLERKTPVKSAPMPKDPYAPLDAPSKKSSEKTSYFCKACRYNFTRAAHIPISTCPYCSASGSVVSKGTASSMIKEVDDMMDDEE